MNFFRRFTSKKRRHLRVDVQLPVKLQAADGSEVEGLTADFSESGFRMEIPDHLNANEILGGSRSLNLSVTLREGEEPLMAVCEFVWARRDEETGKQYMGWMFSHLIEGERRLREFIQETSDGSRSH